MDVTTLLEWVAREFEQTGADAPAWPNPHEDMDGPLEEEYSRCLDEPKYRIVAARAEAWSRALVASGLATREPVAAPESVWDFAARRENIRYPAAEHGSWLRPARATAVPLLLTLRSVHAVDNHLDIGAGDPAVRLVSAPFCGCDACDSGSAELIELIDETVLTVVTGRLVHITAEAGTIQTTWSGSSACGDFSRGDIAAKLHEARAGRSPHAVVRGAAWW